MKIYLFSFLLVAGLLTGKAYADCTLTLANDGSKYTAASCTENEYYIVGNNGAVATEADKSGTLVEITSNSEGTIQANPVPGYYKSGSIYIECPAFGSCKTIAAPSTEACSADNVGKLVTINSSVGLCLGSFKGSNFATAPFAASDTSTYLVQHKAGTIFSFDRTANYYTVSVTEKAITLKVDSTKQEDFAAKSDGKLISRTDELCDIDNSSGRYYTCKKGVCTSTLKTTRDPESNSDSSTCAFTIDNNTCSVATSATCTSSDNGYYLLNDSNGFINTATTGKLIKYTYGETTKCTVVTNTKGYYLNQHAGQTTNTIIKCDGTNCSLVIPTATTCTNGSDVIISGYNVAVCLEAGNNNKLQRFTEANKDYIQGAESSVFGTTSDNFYEITVNKNSMELNAENGKNFLLF